MLPYLHIGVHFVLHLFGRVIPVGPWDIPTFGLMLWVATVCGAVMLHLSFRREQVLDRQGEKMDALGMVALTVVAGIVGAKLWHVLDSPAEFQADGWPVLWSTGGFAWFGGLVAGILALIVQGRAAGLSALRILDLASPAAAVGYAVGRIGCLTSGDGDYGIPTTLPWGMGFPDGIDPTPPGVRVHPTPIYELIAGLAIAWWLWRLGRRQMEGKLGTGAIVGQYLLLTGVARFLVEFIRRNPKIVLDLSNAQLASLGSAAVGVLLIWLAGRRRKASPRKPAEVTETA
jgi:phosphatidylglycerol:prolipoprotein diacylglycerol transferase